MQLFDAGGGLGSRPAPNADVISPAGGWANNDPTGSSPPTIADPDWANAVSAELLAFLTAVGFTASKSNVGQVLAACRILFAAANATAAGPTVNLKANLAAAGTSVTYTADYINVAVSLGGASYAIAAFNETLDVATVGAGGMDTGSAPTSGFVSIYAILNPSTGAKALLGTTASQSTIYGGSNLPAGYTASALVGIWITDSSANLISASQRGQDYYLQVSSFPGQTPLSVGTATSGTAVDLSTLVPAAATAVLGQFIAVETSSIGADSFGTFGATTGLHQVYIGAIVVSLQTSQAQWVPIITASTIYYASGQSSVESSMQILGYRI